jgi:hypothetical protein
VIRSIPNPPEEDAVHDLDRVQLETTDYEYDEEAELDGLAAELLDIQSEAELDEFLGRLITGAAGAARRLGRSDTGRALKGIAKRAARDALPVIGRGIGGLISPDAARGGATIGRGIGQAFGLEVDGLSPQDQQFEAARAYVRWVQGACRGASRMPTSLPPGVAAQRAAVSSARRYAPGLVRLASGSPSRPTSGRWIRRDGAIVLLDTTRRSGS